MAGARDFVSGLVSNPAFAISLASGAWELSARLKLASAGLDLQQSPAAFSDDAHAREDIMRTSHSRAAKAHSRVSFDQVIYIGDGVWDARAALNLGYRFIGRAHDPVRSDRLLAEGAEQVICDYLDVDSIMAVLRRP